MIILRLVLKNYGLKPEMLLVKYRVLHYQKSFLKLYYKINLHHLFNALYLHSISGKYKT